jgi:hypothetical protein
MFSSLSTVDGFEKLAEPVTTVGSSVSGSTIRYLVWMYLTWSLRPVRCSCRNWRQPPGLPRNAPAVTWRSRSGGLLDEVRVEGERPFVLAW